MPTPEIANDTERSRWELRTEGEVGAFADYRRDGETLSFTHTVTEPRLRGRGLAGQLIERALEEARDEGAAVLPYCSYVSEYIARNPEYLELVPADRRAAFGLPSSAD